MGGEMIGKPGLPGKECRQWLFRQNRRLIPDIIGKPGDGFRPWRVSPIDIAQKAIFKSPLRIGKAGIISTDTPVKGLQHGLDPLADADIGNAGLAQGPIHVADQHFDDLMPQFQGRIALAA